ncbi:MAG: lipase chaperone LimK [Alteromonadaceae bacterium]|jgi:lipase chaperone LimK
MKKIHYLMGLATVAVVSGLYLQLANNEQSELPVSQTLLPLPVQTPVQLPAAQQSIAKATLKQVVHQATDEIPPEFYQRMPRSLRGTPPPQTLQVDEQGHLVINQDIQKLFDFYLTATGEEPLKHIIARIKHQLDEQLNQPALSESVDILEGYLQYRNHIAQITNQAKQNPSHDINSPDGIKQVREQIADSREQFLSAQVIEAFFGRQDEYDHYMQGLQLIASNPELTPEQRKQALNELEQQTPQWLREQQQTANRLNEFRHFRQQIKTSDIDLQRVAEQTFGIEAADRFSILAVKRQQWHDKIDDYHQQLASVLINNASNDKNRQEQIAQLREQHFEGGELLRIAVIDRQQYGF